MRLRTSAPLFASLLAAWLVNCSSKDGGGSSPSPVGKTPCSPNAASIQASVFASSCGNAGCHGSEAPAVGLNLTDVSPDQLKGTSSALCSGWALVVPGSPEKSFLYQKLTSSTPACGEPMPIDGALTQADVQCVADWIRGMGEGGNCETCGGNECVALSSDPLHCGQCNNACPAGVACENGSCSCPVGSQACNGACIDVLSDEANCGECRMACSIGSACEAGQCSCPQPLQACGPACADLQADGEHCGDCETVCDAGQVCLMGQCADGCGALQQCGSSCVDVQTSLLHCGGCDQACPGGLECQSGSCACPGGASYCGGSCVDEQTNAEHCGGCGKACGAGEACVGGACQCEVTRTVSFKNDVAPILDAGCTAAGCHTGVRPKEGLDLDVAKSYGELVNVAAAQCGERKLVVPGSPGTSYVMQKLLNVDLCVGSQMPKAGQSLPAAELEAISSWICAGALDN